MVKIVGSLLIITSSTFLGLLFGGRFRDRVNNIKLLYNCIQILETEVIYSANPIPDALYEVYRKGNKKVSYIFKDIKEHLVSNKNSTLLDSFIYATTTFKEKMFLEDEDIEVIISLARSLGVSDRIDQEKHFKTALIQLQTQQDYAEEKRSINEKLYRSLGVLLGLAIVIIMY